MNTFILLLTLIITGLGIAYANQRGARAQENVNQWMEEHGYTILSCERQLLFRWPFSGSSSKNQIVYYVIAQDATAHRYTGWVRCGGFWGGMSSDQVEVRWE